MSEDKARLDERQTSGIREGAGLDEARLNEDFLNLLKKWGPVALVIITILGVGYWLLNLFEEQAREKVDDAYVALEDAGLILDGPRYPLLLEVADKHGDVGSVGLMARQQAADLCLMRVVRGIAADKPFPLDPSLPIPEDIKLDDAGREELLGIAEESYTRVFESASTNPARAEFAVSSAVGLASVAECREDFDLAIEWYDKAIAVAEDAGAPGLGSIPAAAKERLEQVRTLKPLILSEAVPALPPDVQQFFDELPTDAMSQFNDGALQIDGMENNSGVRRLTPEEIQNLTAGMNPDAPGATAEGETQGEQDPGAVGPDLPEPEQPAPGGTTDQPDPEAPASDDPSGTEQETSAPAEEDPAEAPGGGG